MMFRYGILTFTEALSGIGIFALFARTNWDEAKIPRIPKIFRFFFVVACADRNGSYEDKFGIIQI